MRSRFSALAAVPLLSLLLTAGTPPTAAQSFVLPTGGHNIESAWDASFGPGGGTAAIRVLDTGTGSLQLSAHRLVPSTTYPVALYGGRCPVTGPRLVSFGKLGTDKSGKLGTTQPLDEASVATVRAAAAGTGRISIAIGTGSKAPCATLAKSLDVTPRIWFAPIGAWDGLGFVGSSDFAALFNPDAPWAQAAGRTAVYKFYWDWMRGGVSDQELAREVSALNARNLAIAIEVDSVLVPDGCGEGVVGFGAGAPDVLPMIERIARAGGQVRFLALDEPFFNASTYCGWSAAQVADGVVQFVHDIHAAYPSIVVGDIEPWPATPTEQLDAWLGAYAAAAGSPLPFFHVDVDFASAPVWIPTLRQLQQLTESMGTRFGVIYNATPLQQSDQAWLDAARSHFLDFELDGAGPPDDVIFQSWNDNPDYVLPESAPNTFTHLIVDYTRQRTTLALAAPTSAGGGRLAIGGSLATLGTRPIGGAPVDVTVTPRDGPYQVLEYRGTVPVDATQAVIGIRVNTEGAGPAPADLTFYEIGYSEGSDQANRVPDPSFGQGTWASAGTGSFTVVPGDRGSESMLRIIASPDEQQAPNSGTFPVTPGDQYRMWLAVRVPESSVWSTYVAPMFLKDNWDEAGRDIHYLAPAPIPAGSTTTGATGAFLLTTVLLESGRYHLTASYPGDAALWPARMATEGVVP